VWLDFINRELIGLWKADLQSQNAAGTDLLYFWESFWIVEVKFTLEDILFSKCFFSNLYIFLLLLLSYISVRLGLKWCPCIKFTRLDESQSYRQQKVNTGKYSLKKKRYICYVLGYLSLQDHQCVLRREQGHFLFILTMFVVLITNALPESRSVFSCVHSLEAFQTLPFSWCTSLYQTNKALPKEWDNWQALGLDEQQIAVEYIPQH